MTDTNNTDGAALLPVTRAARAAYCDYEDLDGKYRERVMAGDWDNVAGVQAFARFERDILSRAPLPATQEDAERSGADALSDHFPSGLRLKPGHLPQTGEVFDGPIKCECRCGASFSGSDEQEVRQQWAAHAALASLSTAPDTALSTPQRQEYEGEAVREALDKLAEENIALRCMLSAGCYANNDGPHSCIKGASGEFCSQCGEMTRNGKSKPWFSEERLESTMRRLAALAHPAQATPSALSGDAGEVEPFPGCYADLQQRRVATLAKLGLMLSVMASGDAPEVVGYDAAELYAEVLMALAIEDAEDTDIALEIVRDHPEADILAGHRISCPPVTGEAEKVAAWLEQYPTPMNDLDMAMRIRQICARIRAGAHRKSDATPSGEAGEEKPNGVAENKAGGLWYRRWYTAQTRVNKLEALLANPPKHKFWGAGEPDCPREIKAPNGELHTLRCKVCGLDNPRNDLCRAAHQGAGE